MRTRWQAPLPDMPAVTPAVAWRRLLAPPGYPVQWRRLMDAAVELDIGPDELAGSGLQAIAAARGWKPATIALYSKVARYGGLGLPLPRTPEPDPPVLDLMPLTEVRDDALEHLRTVAWCSLALAWPAPVGQFRGLRREQVRVTAHTLLISTPDGDWSVAGALTGWHAWEAARNRFPVLAASPWVLPALRRGPGPASHVGGQLSSQALQVTFGKHAVRTAGHLRATALPRHRAHVETLATVYGTLSYDSYRRLALAGGAEPVAPRGAVRALRRTPRTDDAAGRAGRPVSTT